jgi:hypothetical protein
MLQRYLSKSRQHQSSVIHIQVKQRVRHSYRTVELCLRVSSRAQTLYMYQRSVPSLRASEARRSLYCFTFSADFSFVR